MRETKKNDMVGRTDGDESPPLEEKGSVGGEGPRGKKGVVVNSRDWVVAGSISRVVAVKYVSLGRVRLLLAGGRDTSRVRFRNLVPRCGPAGYRRDRLQPKGQTCWV